MPQTWRATHADGLMTFNFSNRSIRYLPIAKPQGGFFFFSPSLDAAGQLWPQLSQGWRPKDKDGGCGRSLTRLLGWPVKERLLSLFKSRPSSRSTSHQLQFNKQTIPNRQYWSQRERLVQLYITRLVPQRTNRSDQHQYNREQIWNCLLDNTILWKANLKGTRKQLFPDFISSLQCHFPHLL